MQVVDIVELDHMDMNMVYFEVRWFREQHFSDIGENYIAESQHIFRNQPPDALRRGGNRSLP